MAVNTTFAINGNQFNISVTSLQREAAVLDGPGAGRVRSGDMDRDIIGTYYNYVMTLNTKNLSFSDYDTLYELLTSPVDYLTVTMPYGQSTITFKAYVANVSDKLIVKNYWGGMSVRFTAMGAYRKP